MWPRLRPRCWHTHGWSRLGWFLALLLALSAVLAQACPLPVTALSRISPAMRLSVLELQGIPVWPPLSLASFAGRGFHAILRSHQMSFFFFLSASHSTSRVLFRFVSFVCLCVFLPQLTGLLLRTDSRNPCQGFLRRRPCARVALAGHVGTQACPGPSDGGPGPGPPLPIDVSFQP